MISLKATGIELLDLVKVLPQENKVQFLIERVGLGNDRTDIEELENDLQLFPDWKVLNKYIQDNHVPSNGKEYFLVECSSESAAFQKQQQGYEVTFMNFISNKVFNLNLVIGQNKWEIPPMEYSKSDELYANWILA